MIVWQQWTFLAIVTLGFVLQILTIGEEREPLTPGVVVVANVLNALMVWMVFSI